MLRRESLKAARKAAGMSQKELADKTGLSIATIQGYEQGKFQPKLEQIAKISDALYIRPEELIETGDSKGYRPPLSLVAQHSIFEHTKKTIETNDKNALAILDALYILNHDGREKAREQVELLTKIPEYRRDVTDL